MKRFIRYLYEYNEGKRARNVGFVKVDQAEEECVVHIHGKGLRLEEGGKLTLYLFYERGNMCIGIPQGIVDNVNPAVNYRLQFTEEDVGNPENYPQIKGIIMESRTGRKYAAVWDDMPVNVNEMRVWTPENNDKAVKNETEKVEAAERETLRSEKAESEGAELEEAELDKAEPDKVTLVQEMKNEDLKEAVQEQEKILQAESTQAGRKCTRIQRQDIAKLPRCEWRLSNNNFLLHGYYNYHHLLLIEEKGMAWLGVPGIYHPKEARAAEALGFPQFIKRSELEIEGEEREKDEEMPSEDFGYWCRHIRK